VKVFSAKWVVPMDGPPLYDAEVVIDGTTIEAIRPCRTPSNERRDFGNAILLPGLINAHTHLEYTALRGYLEEMPFFPWIRSLTAAKAYLDIADWHISAKLGALECLASGITTIGDNTDVGVTLDAALECGLRGTIYQEFFCIDHRTSTTDIMTELEAKVQLLSEKANDRLKVGVSPHATYTINPEAFAALRSHPLLSTRPMSIHVAESPAEVELTQFGMGEFAEMYERRGIEWQVPHVSPTQYLADQGVLGDNTLLIHAVHQSQDDMVLVAKSRCSIIHCPKSNAKLGAGIAPLTSWLKQTDIKLGIGTDSAVSNNSIDLFEEMRFALLLQRAQRESVEVVSAKNVLELATIRGAEAIGLSGVVGSLTPGKKADMIAVNLNSLHLMPAIDPISAIVYSARASDVIMTMIDGAVCYDEGNFPLVNTTDLASSALTARRKLPKNGG
jgi:cytosine/adenosine deaminase-related metal-dependent hydrolase